MRTGAVIDHAAFNAADPAWYVEFFRAVFGMEVVCEVRDETGALRQVWLHDIGMNLVRMMLEGKGLTVIDLGVDVPPEKFIEAAIENDCSIICCSALLTTTMPVMGEVVEKAVEAGVRDKVKIMIGGAPVTEAFGQSVNADAYTPDATICVEVAMQLLAS